MRRRWGETGARFRPGSGGRLSATTNTVVLLGRRGLRVEIRGADVGRGGFGRGLVVWKGRRCAELLCTNEVAVFFVRAPGAIVRCDGTGTFCPNSINKELFIVSSGMVAAVVIVIVKAFKEGGGFSWQRGDLCWATFQSILQRERLDKKTRTLCLGFSLSFVFRGGIGSRAGRFSLFRRLSASCLSGSGSGAICVGGSGTTTSNTGSGNFDLARGNDRLLVLLGFGGSSRSRSVSSVRDSVSDSRVGSRRSRLIAMVVVGFGCVFTNGLERGKAISRMRGVDASIYPVRSGDGGQDFSR